MTASQVHHVDVIAHAGAVRGGIVVAKHAQLLELAGGYLRNVGHQVIGNPHGILAYEAAFVRADGVEIPQQRNRPIGIGVSHVLKDLLNHVLGPAIGIGAAARMHVFHQGHFVGHAVYRGGRAEHKALHAVPAHGLAQGEGAIQVVAVILQRLGNAFAHCLIACKVDNRVKGVRGKYLVQRGRVGNIYVIAAYGLARDGLQAFQHALAGVVEVIGNYGLMPGLEQLHIGMRTNEARAARQENFHALLPFCH